MHVQKDASVQVKFLSMRMTYTISHLCDILVGDVSTGTIPRFRSRYQMPQDAVVRPPKTTIPFRTMTGMNKIAGTMDGDCRRSVQGSPKQYHCRYSCSLHEGQRNTQWNQFLCCTSSASCKCIYRIYLFF